MLPGQVLQLTGPNGIGKSTLLRTIAGFIKPHSGQIVKNCSEICYVGHRSGLHPDLTVCQNLKFIQAFVSTKVDFSEADTLRCLSTFSLQAFRQRKLHSLSAGQAQQLSLLRLCITTASLWILDEPLAHLDQESSEIVHGLCLKHLQRGGSIVIATHKILDFKPCVVQDHCLVNAI